MKQCPKCDQRFSWWQRFTGEDREHVRHCPVEPHCNDKASLAAHCRGCPAGCFEGMYEDNSHDDKEGG